MLLCVAFVRVMRISCPSVWCALKIFFSLFFKAQYGMDNQGNFREQSLTNMQKAVYAGEMSVADYYERQIELRTAEMNGVDDGSSCTKGMLCRI